MGLAVFGIILIVAGAILMWALNVDISFVDDNVLGVILFLAGLAVVILALVMHMMQGRTKHVEERRYDDSGPRA
jgi:Domain of unknown function (DUF6458)